MGTDVDKLRQLEESNELELSSATLKKASSFIERKSFPKPKHWETEELEALEFPHDLTSLSHNELGRQMGIWTSVIAYTQYEVAMADIENTAKYNKLDYERSKMYVRLSEAGRGTVEQRKASIKADPNIVKLLAESEIARARYILLKALYDSYSKYFNAFSRELSRRGVVGAERPPSDFGDEDVDLSEGRERAKSLFHTMKEKGVISDGDN